MPEALRKPFQEQGKRTRKQSYAFALAASAAIKLYFYHTEGLY